MSTEAHHTAEQQLIVGRYAPSPTGALHLGNLRTALLAWLHARLLNGRFYLRLEDLDTPRTVVGSAEQIEHDLSWLGLDWDGEVMVQSQRLDHYQAALDSLAARDLIYPCFCSRKDIQQAASAPHVTHGVYPGTCAHLSADEQTVRREHKAPALRLRTLSNLQHDCGDFVVKRADGLFAYQLAVVVDDLAQGVSHVVRGSDLESSTGRQRYLAALLDPQATPINYLHAPLLNDQSGQRMSKRDGSQSRQEWQAEGGSAEQLIGLFAQQLGLLNSDEPLNASELLNAVTISDVEAVLEPY